MVFLGPLADIARDRLIEDYPDQFELPGLFSLSLFVFSLTSLEDRYSPSIVQCDDHQTDQYPTRARQGQCREVTGNEPLV